MMNLRVRWMIERDKAEVVEIIKASFFGLQWPTLLHDLRNRDEIAMVAEHGDRVLGFIHYKLERRLFRIKAIAVDPDFRRMKVGAALVAKMMKKCDALSKRDGLVACVPEPLLGAQLFFKACGFKAREILPDEGEVEGEAAYRFTWRAHVPSNA